MWISLGLQVFSLNKNKNCFTSHRGFFKTVFQLKIFLRIFYFSGYLHLYGASNEVQFNQFHRPTEFADSVSFTWLFYLVFVMVFNYQIITNNYNNVYFFKYILGRTFANNGYK